MENTLKLISRPESKKNNIITKRFLLQDGDRIVGEGGIRSRTTAAGDIVYKIYKNERNKGYGKLLLKLLLKEADRMGRKVLVLVCRKSNIPSRKVIEANGGKFIKESKRKNRENRLSFHVDLTD